MKILAHPSGFTKIMLGEEADGSSRRVHLWDSHLPDSIDIHQHRANYASTVIEGAMNEEIWRYDDDPAGDWDRMTVLCWTDELGQYHVDPRGPSVRCRVECTETVTHKAGETYYRDRHDLHRVLPFKLPVVTLVEFGPTYQEVHTVIRKRSA